MSCEGCEATFDAQTGWSEMFLTTPSAPIRGCLRRYFLEVASTPPLEEGTSRPLIHVRLSLLWIPLRHEL